MISRMGGGNWIISLALVLLLLPGNITAFAQSTKATLPSNKFGKWRAPQDHIQIGYFNGQPSNVATYGVTLNLIYTNYWRNDSMADRAHRAKASVTEIEKNGLFSMVELIKSKPLDLAEVESVVDSCKGNKSVIAWYLCDEPTNGTPIPPDDMRAAFELVRKLDPSRRIAVAFPPGDVDSAYFGPLDIFMSHKYPLRAGRAQFVGLETFYEWVINSDEQAKKNGKEFWAIIQGHQAPDYPQGDVRATPTEPEVRYMLYSAVQGGATGVFVYSDDGDSVIQVQNNQWAQSVLPKVLPEFNNLSKAFRGGYQQELDVVPVESLIRATLFRDPAEPNGRYKLLVIHHGSGSQIAKVKLAEGRLLDVSLDSFQVTISSVTVP